MVSDSHNSPSVRERGFHHWTRPHAMGWRLRVCRMPFPSTELALLVGLGSLVPVATRPHATASPQRAIHRTAPRLIRRPRAAIPATVPGKEE